MRVVVVTEANRPWIDWSGPKQFLLWPFAARVIIATNASFEVAASQLEKAAQMAGRGGMIVLSVGHGATGEGHTDEGFFDMAPRGFRVAGNNAVLGPAARESAQVSAFYDVVPSNAGVGSKSRKQEDEERAKSANGSISGPARTRLARWNRYLEIGKAFEANGVGAVILLTCKVGRATEFLRRVRSQLRVPIGAYKRRVMATSVEYFEGSVRIATRTRIFLEGDLDGHGTNVPMGEFWIPMPPTSQWTSL